MKKIPLSKFHDLKCTINYEEILELYGKRTVTILKADSPDSERPNRVTPYRMGWIAEKMDLRTGKRVLVWNKTNWQLTHLLENGHFITNRKDGVKWSAPIPHIRPTFNKIEPKFERAMRKAKVDVTIK